MSCWNRMNPGAMLLMAGLLPLAAAQAHAQSSSAASLLSSSVIALPSETRNQDTDASYDPLIDLTLPETDLLGTQGITTLSHSGSGIGSGWLIGGALGAAAGAVGLVSGGGSSAASLLRTPATTSGTVYTAGIGSTITPVITLTPSGAVTTVSTVIPSNTVTQISTVSGIGGSTIGSGGSTAGSGVASAFSVPSGSGISSGTGGISPFASTPEPGSLALLGGMGLMLTAVKLRRRKR